MARLRRSLLSSRMPDMSCSSHIMPPAGPAADAPHVARVMQCP
jgi:hypothetical protein